MYKVLLVDDEEMVTQGLSRFVKWEEAGFQVAATASSASQALMVLDRETVDLVITDVHMPGQNGLSLIEVLREKYPGVKTVILSGYSEFSYAQQAIRLGVIDYLTKPVNFSAMMTLLKRIRDKLDEEKEKETQTFAAHILILNIANGLPYDEKRASTCLNTRCSIQAVRLSERNQMSLPEDLAQTLLIGFAPCQVVSPAEGELLCVLEGRRNLIELNRQLTVLTEQKGSLCIGISDEQVGYSELRMAFLQAGKAMRYQKARSSAGVMRYEQVQEMFLNEEDESEFGVRPLVELFSSPEDRPQLVERLLTTFTAMETRKDFSLTRVQRFCAEFLLELDTPIQTLSLPDYPRHALLSETLMDVMCAGSFQEVKSYMVNYLKRILKELRQVDEAQQTGELINRVKLYIQKHCAENLTLAVLSEVFYVCPTYLSRLFKKKTGGNFVDYLTELRMEKAKEFLNDPNLMIYNISEMVGYENPRYFSRLFKEATGYTPQEYRNKMHGGETTVS